MLTIHGNPRSTCTRKVLMTLAESATPFELVTVDLAKGEHKSEAYLRRQPFGRVPALQDGGFELHESRAMCRYIARKAGSALAPGDVEADARMEQWISIETSEFTPHAMKFVYHHVFQRAQEPAVLEAAGKALDATCAVMDKQLARAPFIAGATFTLADVFFMPYLEYAMGTPARDIIAKHGRVAAWWKQIGERSTWRKVVGKG